MSYIGQGLPDNQFIGYETEASESYCNKFFLKLII